MQALQKIKRDGRQLPVELFDDQVIGTNATALFANYSTSHWRALVRQGLAPPPIRLSGRKIGWRVGTLRAWIRAKDPSEPQAAA